MDLKILVIVKMHSKDIQTCYLKEQNRRFNSKKEHFFVLEKDEEDKRITINMFAIYKNLWKGKNNKRKDEYKLKFVHIQVVKIKI